MKTISLVILMIFISGCAEYRALISSYGAESADASLETAEWGVCKLPSAGALERRYRLYSEPTGKRASGWRSLCYSLPSQESEKQETNLRSF